MNLNFRAAQQKNRKIFPLPPFFLPPRGKIPYNIGKIFYSGDILFRAYHLTGPCDLEYVAAAVEAVGKAQSVVSSHGTGKGEAETRRTLTLGTLIEAVEDAVDIERRLAVVGHAQHP